MKTRMILLCMSVLLSTWMLRADETVTVTATSSDISENLDLKTVATLFGQAKDLEQFEQLLNDPDSAFSNLDLNGDGDVDYLRVVETADGNRHLVVIQAVLAKDIYQDVVSIFVEKDEDNTVVVQVVGDEYIYGTNYIIEPVYIYRPMIYDWFWGPHWVAWHSPYYWGYYPHWWHTWHCIDPYLYWDHCYWHHYHHPWCSYRTVHHHHPHYRPMHERVRRNDLAVRHPERSFATRNASRNIQNARALESSRRTAVREASAARGIAPGIRISQTSTRTGSQAVTRNNTYGSTNVRTSSVTRTAAGAATRTATTATRGTATRTTSTTTTRSTTAGTTTRSTTAGTTIRGTTTTRTSTATPVKSSSTTVRTSTSTSPTRTTSSTVRTSTSSSSSVSRSGGYTGGGGSTRTSGGSYGGGSAGGSRSGGGSVRR